MGRSELIESIECKLFDVYSLEPLSSSERYAVREQSEDRNGRLAFSVIGSRGTQANLWASDVLPSEPFLIMRGFAGTNGSAFRYQAITVSNLDALTQQIQPPSSMVP